jgi:sugar diacid utilization regulator
MTEKDKLLKRLLTRIQQHGYYHQVDVALVDWFTTNASVQEIGKKYLVHPNAMYQQKSRLARQEE